MSIQERAHKNTQSIGAHITLMSMTPTQVHNTTIAHGMSSITTKTKSYTKTKLQMHKEQAQMRKIRPTNIVENKNEQGEQGHNRKHQQIIGAKGKVLPKSHYPFMTLNEF